MICRFFLCCTSYRLSFSRCMIRPLIIHSVILQKYRKECSTDKINNNNIDSVVQEEGRDEFYDVIKTRVKNVLLERGIDPVNDRGATPLRTAYYILILCFWLASGYSHIMVSVLSFLRSPECCYLWVLQAFADHEIGFFDLLFVHSR